LPGKSRARARLSAEFCEINYGVSFPMYEKIDVNGSECASFVQISCRRKHPGYLGSKSIKWNFTKFLVDQDGRVLKRFCPENYAGPDR
jgi:glutathione peroxidase